MNNGLIRAIGTAKLVCGSLVHECILKFGLTVTRDALKHLSTTKVN